MKVNNVDRQSFGIKINVPTVLSKKKMQTAIEGMTRISRNNLLATNSNWMYSDPADYTLVLIKYLSTKVKMAIEKAKATKKLSKK